jgi:hypothetical protein
VKAAKKGTDAVSWTGTEYIYISDKTFMRWHSKWGIFILSGELWLFGRRHSMCGTHFHITCKFS